MAVHLKGVRYVLFVGAIVGVIGAALYPIVLKPMMGVDEYKNIRKQVSGSASKQ
ncbi:small integral membrane protein 20 [Stomoxys calcitrans]|uniref:Uncharacterized protein n=1 Tax=Stomoxys calcitrans TaxID=35570 RepID=A0A1I8P1A4_STOCA|nr:small integral membrane protein 20 [Stomoxys calcitrans]